MSDNRLYAVITFFVVTAFLVCVAMVLKTCEAQRDRRAACIQQGYSAVDCRLLFPQDGDR